MKKALLVLLVSGLAGCGGATLHNAKKAAWDGAMGAIIPGTGTTTSTGSAASGQTGSVVGGGSKVIAKEDIFYQQEQRTAKNYGSIVVAKRERNPGGRTIVVFSECSHPKIGINLECNLGMREVVSQEGWLSKSMETIHNLGDQLTLAAGKYYVITHNDTGSNARYVASGEIDVQVGLTNYITAVLE